MLLRMQASESMQRLRHACHAVMTRWLDEMEGNEAETQAGDGTPGIEHLPPEGWQALELIRPRTRGSTS